ncbi:MAG: hypothetical protein COX65_06105 [Elusimicrobia bacterium CG_4_10_14_0_2_um_filter_56_8]|nr:MAG: hypothetical protein AUJ51_06050 [Elusimicrobia bacterium CG1_02_56_21]PJA14059.1 MAG: hypothetical protein COX65_06105 [Elusimicrobia bacterium CG_4_10_14_0_2_um_filter_56_8]
MLREKTLFAQKIIDFYTDKGVECSVVDEHLSLLVTLSAEGKTHEFRYGNRAFAKNHCGKKFYMVLEKEWSNLKGTPAAAAPSEKNQLRLKYRALQEGVEEAGLNI